MKINVKNWLREEMLLLATIYFFCGTFGLALASLNKSVSPIWPPTGVALAVLVLRGRELWPGVFLGAFLVNIVKQGTLLTALGMATGNTLEAYTGAWLVCRYAGGERAFERVGNVLRLLLLAGIMSTAVSATFGVLSLCLGGFVHWNEFSALWITWWMGDLVSNVTIAPLLIIWLRRPIERLKPVQIPEVAALLITVMLVGQIAFLGNSLFGSNHKQPLEYVAILPLLWAAFRFGTRGAITTAVLLSAIAVW